LAALVAVLLGFGLIRGRTELGQLASLWHIVVGGLLLAALVSSLFSAYWLLQLARQRSDDYEQLYELTGDAPALAAAVRLRREALDRAPVSTRDLDALWKLLLEQGDTTEALAVLRRATRIDDINQPYRLDRLATLLREAYGSTREIAHQRELVDVSRRLARAVASGSPARRSLYLAALGLGLRGLYAVTRDLAVLSESMAAYRAAADIAPHPAIRAMQLGELGLRLQDLYDQTGDRAALDEAVRRLREACDAMPLPAERGRQLYNLGSALGRLAAETSDFAVHHESISVYRQALRMLDDEQVRGYCMASLASALEEVARRTDDPAALREATGLARDAATRLVDDEAAELADNGLWHRLSAMAEQSGGDPAVVIELVAVARRLADRPAPDDVRAWRLSTSVYRCSRRTTSTATSSSLEPVGKWSRCLLIGCGGWGAGSSPPGMGRCAGGGTG
jgi:tetratricopeptide (TPR) repeat protein